MNSIKTTLATALVAGALFAACGQDHTITSPGGTAVTFSDLGELSQQADALIGTTSGAEQDFWTQVNAGAIGNYQNITGANLQIEALGGTLEEAD